MQPSVRLAIGPASSVGNTPPARKPFSSGAISLWLRDDAMPSRRYAKGPTPVGAGVRSRLSGRLGFGRIYLVLVTPGRSHAACRAAVGADHRRRCILRSHFLLDLVERQHLLWPGDLGRRRIAVSLRKNVRDVVAQLMPRASASAMSRALRGVGMRVVINRRSPLLADLGGALLWPWAVRTGWSFSETES